MQSEKQNPVFVLWLEAYESQLVEIIQRGREAQKQPDRSSEDSPGGGSKVTNK